MKNIKTNINFLHIYKIENISYVDNNCYQV